MATDTKPAFIATAAGTVGRGTMSTTQDKNENASVPAVKCTRTKAAWIRDNVPPGQPAPGRFDCECGRPVRAGYFGQGPAVTCDCGLIYDNQGYITRPAAKPMKTIWDIDKPVPGEQYLICPPPRRR